MELRLCVTVRFVCEFAISFHAFLVNRTPCHIACTDVNTVSTQRIALICCTLTRGSSCAFHKIFVPSLVPRHVSRPAVHPALWPHIHSSLLLFRSPAQAQGWSRPENTAPIHEASEVTNLRIQNLAHFFAWPSVSQDHEEMCASDFSKSGNFSIPPADILDSDKSLWLSTMHLLVLHSRWVQPQKPWSRNDVGSPKSKSFMSIFHIGFRFCFFPAILISFTYTDKNNLYVRLSNMHSIWNFFPSVFSSNFLESPCPEMLEKMKWKLALKIATSPSDRWLRKAADWNPELSTRYRINRAIGRPRKRWEDDINEFLKQEFEDTKNPIESSNQTNKAWISIAKDRGSWALLEEAYTMTVEER